MQGEKTIGWTDSHAFLARAERDLDVALQPLVDLNGSRVHGYEALVRRVDSFAVDSPPALYDLAALHGCVVELEAILWHKACQKFAGVDDFERLKLFLNIDGRSIAASGASVIDMVTRAARLCQIEPTQICLELSESTDIMMLHRLADVRAHARQKGIWVAIDDFGKGYSQMKFLHELEPDLIKIDRFFITDIDCDARKYLLVSSVVRLAHRLGIRIVAEGIETPEELAACRALGADIAQGYFIGRPQTDLDTIGDITNLALLSVVNLELDGVGAEALAALEEVACVSVNDKPESVIQRFKDDTSLRVLPVVSGDDEPVGIILEEDLRQYLYNPYGHMLLRNSGIHDLLAGLIRKVPIADYRTPLCDLVPTGAISDAACILITKSGRYLGIITTQALLRAANDDRVRQAEEQNPLTQLPGNRLIHKNIEDYGERTDVDRYFFYFDFDAFKPFNDKFGFSAGDRAIQMFGDLLRAKFSPLNAFIGHVGGDDFFVSLHDVDRDRAVEAAEAVRAEFSASAVSFYAAEDKKNGYFTSTDRDGNHVKHKLLTCSVGIAHLKRSDRLESLDQFGSVASQIKKQAKAAPQGVVLRDMPGVAARSPKRRMKAVT
ncbi:MAG: EAL domain-containing protein [Pseudomonadota bacterium]